MRPSTIFLGRLIGLSTLIFSLAIALRRADIVATMSALVEDRPLLLIFGLIALVSGLAIVLLHNVWTGGVLPVLITLVGWIFVIRGLALLFLSPQALAGVFAAFHFEERFFLYAGLAFAFGLALTLMSFRARRA